MVIQTIAVMAFKHKSYQEEWAEILYTHIRSFYRSLFLLKYLYVTYNSWFSNINFVIFILYINILRAWKSNNYIWMIIERLQSTFQKKKHYEKVQEIWMKILNINLIIRAQNFISLFLNFFNEWLEDWYLEFKFILDWTLCQIRVLLLLVWKFVSFSIQKQLPSLCCS